MKTSLTSTSLITAVALSLGLLPASRLFAASQTWAASPTSANWVASGGDNNWGTANVFPGSTTIVNTPDIATFLTSSTSTIGINSTPLYIRGINFGVSGSTPSAFTIGTTAGNSLFLTSGGNTQIVGGITGTNIVQTINAPIVIQPATGTAAATYAFTNNSTTASNTLVFGGAISGGTTTQRVALTLTGSNSGNNTINGAISNGGAVSGVSVAKASTSTWSLTGLNTYTGATSISGAVTSGGSIIGQLALRGANGALTATSAINMTGGILSLDNTTASGGPNSNRLNDSAAINASAGPNSLVFAHSGVASTNYSETVGALNLSGGDFLVNTSTATTNQTSALTFSSFNRTGVSTLSFVDNNNLGSSTNAQNRVIFTGQANSTFLGGWATFGGQGDFAAYDTTRGVIQAVRTAGLATLTAVSSNSTLNYRATGNATTTLVTSNSVYNVNALGFSFVTSSTAATLDLNGSTVKLSGGGITTAAATGTFAVSNGTITAADTASPTTLYLHSRSVSGGAFTISASIADPTGGGSLSLVKAGNSPLSLSAANTYSGATTVNSGTLLIAAGGSINNTSKITAGTGTTIQNENGAAITRSLTLTEGSNLITNAAGSSFTTTNGLELVGNLSDGWLAIALTNNAGSGLIKGGALTFTLSGITAGTYDLDGNSAGFSGTFGSAFVGGSALSTLDGGVTFTGTNIGGFDYSFANSTNSLTIAVTAVPEPSTYIGGGLILGLAAWSQRKRFTSPSLLTA